MVSYSNFSLKLLWRRMREAPEGASHLVTQYFFLKFSLFGQLAVNVLNTMNKILSLTEAVQAAAILFELNTDPHALQVMYHNSGLAEQADRDIFVAEWLAYVHACLVYALMEQAPTVVVVEYLRQTGSMLQSKGYEPDFTDEFIDQRFSQYLSALTEQRAKDCPRLLFRAVCGEEIVEIPPKSAWIISAAMSMVLSAILDKLEEYDYGCG